MAPVSGAHQDGFTRAPLPPGKNYRYYLLKMPVFALKYYRYPFGLPF